MISSRDDMGRNKHIKMSNKQIGKTTLSCNAWTITQRLKIVCKDFFFFYFLLT
jgi:hypothetical protein